MGSLNYNLVDSMLMYLSGIYENTITAKLAKVLGYSENIRDLSITNLTKLDIPSEYGSYKITDFLFIPPIVSNGKRIIGIATLGDEMNISYHLFEDEHLGEEEEFFRQVMERMKKS
jgi:hypothetical protein